MKHGREPFNCKVLYCAVDKCQLMYESIYRYCIYYIHICNNKNTVDFYNSDFIQQAAE